MILIRQLLEWVCRVKRGGLVLNFHTLSAAETRDCVELLACHFDLIGHDELPGRLQRRGKRPFCLLTFDDGKRSNATETAPELERLGVPGVFYVVTDFLSDGSTPLWFDRYAALRRAVPVLPAALDRRVLKLLPHDLREERVRRVCERFGIDAALGDDDVAPMSWQQARGLAERGHTVGAHTQRHAILTTESRERALDEIESSVRTVGEQLGQPCKSFAFPNGNYTAKLALHAVDCGVETVMTTEPTWVDPGSRLWRLPRVQLHADTPRWRHLAKLVVAASGRSLRNPDGTGRIYVDINRRARRARSQATPKGQLPTPPRS